MPAYPRGKGAEKPAYFRPVDLGEGVQRHVFDINKPETWDALPPPERTSRVARSLTLSAGAFETRESSGE